MVSRAFHRSLTSCESLSVLQRLVPCDEVQGTCACDRRPFRKHSLPCLRLYSPSGPCGSAAGTSNAQNRMSSAVISCCTCSNSFSQACSRRGRTLLCVSAGNCARMHAQRTPQRHQEVASYRMRYLTRFTIVLCDTAADEVIGGMRASFCSAALDCVATGEIVRPLLNPCMHRSVA